MDFRGKTFEAIIKTLVDEQTVVVTGENLLMPVACSRTELQPLL
jgi:hypothetical protein